MAHQLQVVLAGVVSTGSVHRMPSSADSTPATLAPAGRRTARRRWARVLVMAAAVVVAGCSAGAPSRSEFVDVLRTSGLSEQDAGCVADAVLGELSEDEVALIADRGPSGAPVDDPQRDDDANDRVRAAIAECRVAGEPAPSPEPEPVPLDQDQSEDQGEDQDQGEGGALDPGGTAEG